MTEDEFWNSTPKKLDALFKIYKKVSGNEEDDLDLIDNIIF